MTLCALCGALGSYCGSSHGHGYLGAAIGSTLGGFVYHRLAFFARHHQRQMAPEPASPQRSTSHYPPPVHRLNTLDSSQTEEESK